MFTETQRFRQWWVWVIMGFIVLTYIGSLVAAGGYDKPVAWLSMSPMLLIVLLLYLWRLDTRLDSDGIHYRVFPIFAWRTIPWNTIRSASVTEYGFVGYGIR